MFLTDAELAQHLGVSATDAGLHPAIQAGESTVEALLGATSLAVRNTNLTVTPTRPKRVFELPDGPATSITSVTIGGAADAEAWVLMSPWMAVRKTRAGTGQEIVITHQSGWPAGGLPDGVRRAMLLAAAEHYTRPDLSVSSTREGTVWTDFTDETLRKRLDALLARYARPPA